MHSAASPFSLQLFSGTIHDPKTPDRKSFLVPNFSFNRHIISLQRIPIKSSPSSPPFTSLQLVEELPPKLQEIIKLFQSVPDQTSMYQQVLFYGKSLTPLDARFRTRENRVEGCVSHVWIRAFLDSKRNVVLEADSDSKLTKGLAALLVRGLSGCLADEIIRVSQDFITLLGQRLTPSRNNGFLNMLRLVQKKALLLLSEGEIGEAGLNPEVGFSDSALPEPNFNDWEKMFSLGMSNVDHGSSVNARVETTSDTSSLGSRGQRIKEVLERELSPIEMDLEDVSYQHIGHAGAQGSDSETHINLRVESKEFKGKSMVKRHRLVHGLLEEEMKSGLHALSILAKSPSEV